MAEWEAEMPIESEFHSEYIEDLEEWEEDMPDEMD